MNKLNEKYNELVHLILKYGEYFPKRYGNWIKLKYIDDYYFCMDSWNKSIDMMINPIYNGYDFSGKALFNLGIDFGGFECRVKEEQLDCWIENLKYELGRDNYDFSKIKLENI